MECGVPNPDASGSGDAALPSIARRYEQGYTRDVKTAVSIPNAVFDSAEKVSKRLGVSRSRFYTMAIERLLKRERSRGVREALDAVYSNTKSRLDPALAAMQAISLASDEKDW